MPPSARAIALVAPPAHRAPSGGDRLDDALAEALAARGPLRRLGFDELAGDAATAPPTAYLLDSLGLDALDAPLPAHHRRWLLAHLLPSQDPAATPAARAAEADRLARLDGAIAFSGYMTAALREAGAEGPLVEVTPALPAWARPATAAPILAPPRLLVVAHLAPVKGVVELLEALAAAARPDDRFVLRVLGEARDPATARRAHLLAASAALRGRVELLGPAPHAALAAAYAEAALVLSPAWLETYGLALAEARAIGAPLAVLDGGHAAAHVTPTTGVVAADHVGLAAAALDLVRTPARLAELAAAARAAARALPRPTWADAAARIADALEAP
jgi:glycosyltransferase involved in cell wall biosynthesis